MNHNNPPNTVLAYKVEGTDTARLSASDFSSMRTHLENSSRWIGFLRGHGYIVAIDQFYAAGQPHGFSNGFFHLLGKAEGTGSIFLVIPEITE